MVYLWNYPKWLNDYVKNFQVNQDDGNIINILKDNKGHIDVNLRYTYSSLIKSKNFFRSRPIKRIIKVPTGTNAFFTESEIILGRGIKKYYKTQK